MSARGYTISVNEAARRSSGDFLIILNSDTIVPPFWLARLCAPMVDDETITATGPLSNAATWQSVPEIKAPDGSWAVNELPDGYSVSDFDLLVQRSALGLRDRPVELLNGFCYAIRKQVFEQVYGLDGISFPSGYGEETDLFLRIRCLGYGVHVVPNLFVFHAKSKSFGAERRKELSKRGNEILYSRHGKPAIQAAAQTLENCPALRTIRQRVSNMFSTTAVRASKPSLKIAFLLPVRPGGGGVHSVVQEAEGLRDLGHQVVIIVPEKQKHKYENFYPSQMKSGLFLTFVEEAELPLMAAQYHVVVATHFKSVRMLRSVQQSNGHILFMYYIQDYEPWITQAGSDDYIEAFASYGELRNNILIAKTNWICRMVEKLHGVRVNKIAPSIEHKIYNVEGREGDNRVASVGLCITAMIRPKTPRRGAQATIDVLAAVKRAFPDCRIEVFGCGDPDLASLSVPEDLQFKNHGVLVREDVAALLKRSDLFIDMSTYQAFGRTAVEAMACGSVAAIPVEGGGGEYSVGGLAALSIPIDDTDTSAQRIVDLLNDREAYELMRRRGYQSAVQFSKNKAAISFERVILRQLNLDAARLT
jgi:GT2 family glycosyltransferase/glycosyltransferase involved in cell wall biosynthesis